MADVLYDPEPQRIGHAGLHGLHDYWAARGRDGRLPARRDIDPVDIPDLLPQLMLIDVARAGDPASPLQFRLVGTALVRRFGRDFTGQPVAEASFGADWENTRKDYGYVIGKGRPCLRHNRGVGLDRRTYEYWCLLLPLAGDGCSVDMLLAGVTWLDAG